MIILLDLIIINFHEFCREAMAVDTVVATLHLHHK